MLDIKRKKIHTSELNISLMFLDSNHSRDTIRMRSKNITQIVKASEFFFFLLLLLLLFGSSNANTIGSI